VSLYAGSHVALATRHGKQRVIGRALWHGLGAELLHLKELDTDQLGSFCGVVPRLGSARDACLLKAELALRHGGTHLAIASEGSFGPHPSLPFLPAGLECMVFLDRVRGLTIYEELLAHRTNFAQRTVAPPPAGTPGLPPELETWLEGVGFPAHALLVRSNGAAGNPLIRKGIQDAPTLLSAIRRAAAASDDGLAQLETDMRAHRNPTRMASIRRLSFRLVRRLATTCPSCGSPGWGRLESEPGLPCGWCGQPTPLVRFERYGCSACGTTQARARADGLTRADPGQCAHCNP
jgi:hypothetical protein